MIKRLWDGICDLLHDGGPSMTRVINFIVALTGAWLLFFWARAGGDMEWPWAACFISYLIYGAGPHVVKQAIDAIKFIKGGSDVKASEQETK